MTTRGNFSWSFILCMTIIAGLLFPKTFVRAATDTDHDGLFDDQEINIYYTDPIKADTDGDGFLDGDEVAHGFSPLHGNHKHFADVDSDHDDLTDDWEIKLGTNLTKADTDGDGYKDGDEVMHGYDPLSPSHEKISKRIEVSLKSQHLAYFFGNTKLEDFPISSGLPKTPTPVGSFSILKKRPVVHYKGVGFNFPNTKWNLMFKHGKGLNYYIHGAYWHHNFGHPMSHGCVNVSYANMEKLYAFADENTPITIQ